MRAPSFPPFRLRFRSRPLVFSAFALLALGLHAAVLLDAPSPTHHRAQAEASSATRLHVSMREQVDAASQEAVGAPSQGAHAAPVPATARLNATATAKPRAAARVTPAEPPAVIAADDGFVSVAAAESQVAEPAASASAPDVAATYRTRIPKPFTFRYDMRRGAIGGVGELSWKPTSSAYEAQLKGSVGALSIIGWISTGGFDAHGLSPVRYVDHRIGKSDQAANFQRAEGKITFSGSSNEYAVQAGAQDRLSWMIQLPAILAADPAKAKAGTRLSVFVVGAHGDAEVWVFESSGNEQVSTPAGSFNANKWSREPRRPHDTMVEVWLDPGHQYLPVKARLSNPPSDAALDLEVNDFGS